MQLEVKQIAKVEKETLQGIEVTSYKCVLKGGDNGSKVKASLTLESADPKELDYLVSQQIGEEVHLSLESVNRKLTEFASGTATVVLPAKSKEILADAAEQLREQDPPA